LCYYIKVVKFFNYKEMEFQMKYTKLALALGFAVITTTANAGWFSSDPEPTAKPQTYQGRYSAQQEQQSAVQASQGEATVKNIPQWYIEPPLSSDKVVYVAGTGVSNNLGMAKHKALMDAQTHLADQINSVVNGKMDSFSKDSGVNGSDTYEDTTLLVSKLISDANVSGYHVDTTKVIQEGRGFRFYVLLAYPLNEGNVMQQKQAQDKANRAAPYAKAKAEAKLEKQLSEKHLQEQRDAEGVAATPVAAPIEATPVSATLTPTEEAVVTPIQ
jgi:hypothetical protein